MPEFEHSPTSSIRDVASTLSDAIRAKGSGLYKQLDAATGGGRFQRFEDALDNINKGIRESIGVDESQEQKLLARKAEVETAQQTALQKAKDAGVDPSLVDKASASWKQQGALSDLSHAVQKTTTGLRPELVKEGVKSSPETINPKQLFARINGLNDSGRLAEAIGPDNAANLLRHRRFGLPANPEDHQPSQLARVRRSVRWRGRSGLRSNKGCSRHAGRSE